MSLKKYHIYIKKKFDFETTIKVDFHSHVNFMLVTHMYLTGFTCVNKIQDNAQDPRFKWNFIILIK